VGAYELIVVGDVMLDVVVDTFPAAGRRAHAPVTVRAGGAATNAALAAAGHGARSLVVGRVGDDAAAVVVRSALADARIEARLAVDPALPTGTVLAAGAGTSAVADRGANAALAVSDLGELDAAALLVSGYALLQAGSADAAREALARTSARWRAVDIGAPGLAAAARRPKALAGADTILADEEEARALTGLGAEAAARALGERFRLAVVKRGAAGAVASLVGTQASVPGTPVAGGAKPGAGDAFDAVLLVELSRGRPLADALAAASRAGADAAA
jgi:sugar/nucleoside kinase (ribokinase family)